MIKCLQNYEINIKFLSKHTRLILKCNKICVFDKNRYQTAA